ncbi:MAG: glycosyltransferase [Gemmatimonadales bacterium]
MAFLRAFRRAANVTDVDRTAALRPGAVARTSSYAPPVTLVVTMRGLDPGLEENLDAYLSQDYADYQTVFITDREDDPSFAVGQQVGARHPAAPCRVLVAGEAEGRGQKVHNLLHALDEVRERDRVLAFGDSDIRPGPGWLRDLVEPLADPEVGTSTGFRWHVPVQGGLASVLRSVWNAGIASLMTGRRPPFAWGGAMAIRRETFEAAGVRQRWLGTLSDDYVLTGAVQDLGLTVRFEPRCLSFTYADCSMKELLDWSFRQLAITRVYRPVLWRVGLAGELFGNLTFWGGLAVLVAGLLATAGRTAGAAGDPTDSVSRLVMLAALLATAWAARGVKGWMRLRGATDLFPDVGSKLRRWRAAYLLATPLSSLLSLSGFLRSASTREISWRGIRYRMVSPSRTEVLH